MTTHQNAHVGHPDAAIPHDVTALFEPHRRELHLHCYRMLGSLQDAEDMVQETMVRAWQRFATFRGEASVRTWLYRIATNACLDVLKAGRPRRILPQTAYPLSDPFAPIPAPVREPIWLEPLPASWCSDLPDDPETHYTRREQVSLAFLTALQVLPPRQRAILMLADVLDWRAAEIASLLELSVSAVNSALHRARATMARQYHREDYPAPPQDDHTAELLRRYVRAWEHDDVDGLVALLKTDATFSMPPFPCWYAGREAIQRILTMAAFRPGAERQWRLLPATATGDAAFALYRADAASNTFLPFGIQVLTLHPDGIRDLTIFHAPALIRHFALPGTLPAC